MGKIGNLVKNLKLYTKRETPHTSEEWKNVYKDRELRKATSSYKKNLGRLKNVVRGKKAF